MQDPPDTTRTPDPGRRQFGLRKLMLWTAVVALWCGTYTSLRPHEDAFKDLITLWRVATPWFALAASVHIVFGWRTSAFSSTALGIILAVLYMVAIGVPFLAAPLLAFICSVGLAGMGAAIGFAVATWIRLLFEFVDSVDRRLAGKRG